MVLQRPGVHTRRTAAWGRGQTFIFSPLCQILIPVLITMVDELIRKRGSLLYSITKGYIKAQDDTKYFIKYIFSQESVNQVRRQLWAFAWDRRAGAGLGDLVCVNSHEGVFWVLLRPLPRCDSPGERSQGDTNATCHYWTHSWEICLQKVGSTCFHF